jgi:hypothetical protein
MSGVERSIMRRFSFFLLLALSTFSVGIALKSIWTLSFSVPKAEIPGAASNCNLLFLEEEYPDYKEIQAFMKQKQGLIAEMLDKFDAVPLEKLPLCIDESYRLIIIPVSDYPLSIQVLRSQDNRILFVEKLNQNGYATRKGTEYPTEEEWQNLKSLLDQNSFWYLPTFNENQSTSKESAILIMEGISGGKYHYVQRPATNNEFREISAYMVKLSELKIEE